MNRNSSKLVRSNLETSVLEALAKYAPKVSVPFEGALIASKDLQTQLQAHVDAMNAVSDAQAKYSQLVALEHQQRGHIDSLLAGIKGYAAATFGQKSPQFAAFGFKPKKVAQRSPLSKVEAGDKLRATRLARHTMGKRQRESVHGVTIAPANGPVASPLAGGASIETPSASPTPIATPPANAGANGAATNGVVATGPSH